ncbi:hypothetical protein K443DRAFT_677260, partial [Laccaria amethystina LaAM-08-1]
TLDDCPRTTIRRPRTRTTPHARMDRQRPHARTTATAHPRMTTAHGYHGPQQPPTHPQRPSV